MTFVRRFTDLHIEKLQSEPLFDNCLRPDVVEKFSTMRRADRDRDEAGHGEVFPAIREDRLDFYHKGGKLFSYKLSERFKTHHKYASVIKHDNDYVDEKSLQAIGNFVEGYERIKENCAHYAGDEAIGVSRLYEQFSCAKPTRKDGVVVLDIEISLRRDDGAKELQPGERSGSDRIDLLLFDTESGWLRFFEAKLFSNNCLRSRTTPAIVEQMKRYGEQLDGPAERAELLTGYREHVRIINKLFRPDSPLREPVEIDPKPRLLIFGFDGAQLKGKLDPELQVLKNAGLSGYRIANIASVDPGALFKGNW